MVDIIVRNYQAIKEAKIQVKGITVLRGESNAGKSSFLKALYAATHNRFRIGCIRNGEEFTEVKVRFEKDGDILSVKRYPTGSPIIKLGKQVWTKLNRDLPNEVLNFTNFGKINVSNSETYSLNFYNQFEPPLLSGFSQKKIMDILSASKAVDDLNKVRKEVDIRKTKNRGAFEAIDAVLTETKTKLAQVQMQLDDLEPLNKADVLYQRCSFLLEQLSKLKYFESQLKVYNLLNKKCKLLEKANLRLDDFEHRLTRLSKLKGLRALLKLSRQLRTKSSVYSKLLLKSDELENIQDSCSSLVELEDTILVHDSLTKKYNLLSSLVSLADKFEGLDFKLKKIHYLKSLVGDFKSLNSNLESLNNKVDISNRLEYKKSQSSKISERQSKLHWYLSEVESYYRLKVRVNEISEIIDNNLCPLCKQPLSNHETNH